MKVPAPAKLAAACLLLLAAALWVPLNQDEGWILLAARRVAQGLRPYQDFTFTQGQGLAWVYRLAALPLQWAGFPGARLFQALIAFASLCLLWVRLPSEAARRALLILFFLPLPLQFLLTIKSYAAGAFFLLAAAICWQKNERPAWLAASGLCLAAATTIRISAFAAFLPLTLFLLLPPRRAPIRHTALFLGPALLLLAAAYLPAWLDPQTDLLFQIFGFHRARVLNAPHLFRAASLLRTLYAFLPLGFLVLLFPQQTFRLPPPLRPWVWSLALITAIHVFAPIPYEEYHTLIYPLLLYLLLQNFELPESSSRRLTAFCALTALMILGSPRLHGWLPHDQDRIWWSLRAESEALHLQRVARELNALSVGTSEGLLFTPDSYLAIAMQAEVPRGLEMGPFSFATRFPRDEFLNLADITAAIGQSDWVAFTPYFFLESPQVLPMLPETEAAIRALLEQDFLLIREIPAFGQQRTPLQVWQRQPLRPAATGDGGSDASS